MQKMRARHFYAQTPLKPLSKCLFLKIKHDQSLPDLDGIIADGGIPEVFRVAKIHER